MVAFVLAFAGGAILCMLTATMVPEAYERAGREVGLVATLGFGLRLTSPRRVHREMTQGWLSPRPR